MTHANSVAQVLLDSSLPQLDHLFDYAVPAQFRDSVAVGQRVKVPLRAGARQAFGYIVNLSASTTFTSALSEITLVVSHVPMLSPEIYELARRLADRAAGNANDIIRLAIPTRQVRVEKDFLLQHPDGFALRSDNLVSADSSASTPQRLAVSATPHPVRLSTGEWCGGWVYDVAQRALPVLKQRKSVIIAVPDHVDLTAVVAALGAVGVPSERVLRSDTQQSNAQRYRSFLHALTSEAHVIVGNRSVVYAPASDLGAIIVFDDADQMFDEPLTPYVNARDAAILRSELQGAELHVVSHVRSLEVQRLVELGYMQAASSNTRGARRMLSHTGEGEARAERIPSLARNVIRNGLKHGPVLVQVASPGRATAMFCAGCSQRQRCPECAGPLIMSTSGATGGAGGADVVNCRWCEHRFLQHHCHECSGTSFRESGAGSVLTVEQLEQQFPGTTIRRSDAESRATLVDSRAALIVATRGAEPLAAGGYAAVILLDGERVVARESLRAEEDALRTWCNAAALARPDGQVVLTNVQGKLADAFALRSEEAWAGATLNERRQLRFPPAIRVATIAGPSAQVQQASTRACELQGVDQQLLPPTEGGVARVVLRFPYAQGAEVAKVLRAEVIASAAISRKPKTAGTRSSHASARLRVRMDDRNAFERDG